MFGFGIFLAGFATGWVARSTVDSSHAAFVKGVAGVMSAVDRIKRAVAIEREHIEDLVAEARSLYEARRAAEARQRVGREPVEAANDRAA